MASEPLEESAPLARKLASQYCEGCAWSHGIWQYLRLLDVVTTPAHHEDFFRAGFDAVQGTGGTVRILISGTADYSMVSVALAAFRARGIVPDITVIDLCRTPLELCLWYAERSGARITALRADALEFAGGPFDVVCSHSFLGRFDPDQRRQLVRNWHGLLRPGGLAITVKRVRPDSGPGRIGFDKLQAQAFRERVVDAARAWSGAPLLSADELALAADEYARRFTNWPLRSAEEIRELFEGGGFVVQDLKSAAVGKGASGPTVRGGAPYVKIIARRP